LETGYIAALWFLIISVLTVPLMMGIGWLLRPRRELVGMEGEPYECGEKPVGSAWIKFNIRFYVVAIVFIVFDVEVAAIFPVATIYRAALDNGTIALVFAEIFLFVGLLVLGLIYCWVRGDLEWVKGVYNTSSRQGSNRLERA
jgi:NADH-quinone oxidoreductase subunit A